MHGEKAPALPILDKSWLFLPLPTDPQNPNKRYLQCPATGQVYCPSTGSLYWNILQVNPLTTNILSLSQRPESCSFPSSPKPWTMKHTDQPLHGNGASTTPRIESSKSPRGRDANQSVQGNRESITQSNNAPNVENNSQHLQQITTPNIVSNKTLKAKHGDKPILPIRTPNTVSNKTPIAKHEEKPILDNNTANISRDPSKTSSSVKNNFDPTTKKHKNKKKHSRTIKNKSDYAKKNVYVSSKKSSQQQSKNETEKQKKTIVLPQSKPTKSFINRPSITEHSKPNTKITPPALSPMVYPASKNQSKIPKHFEYNPFLNFKRKSFRYHIINFTPMHVLKEPFKINLDHLLYPEKAFPPVSVNIFQKLDTKFQACSSLNSTNKYSSKAIEKPSLYLCREDHAMIAIESSFRRKTARRNAFVKKSYSFDNMRRIDQPFNRRPRHHYNRRRRSSLGQYRNCIMASAVHEIIHSRFAKNTDEHMPVSQIKAMLSSGDWKLRRRQRWIQRMEKEAIHKYRELNDKCDLQVEEYDLLHHPEKSWLASYGHWVINRKDGKSWPLLLKCLHKYPDSTLRQACTHRSFCLSWNGKSYSLRMDHAYYTQIQCHMAITNTTYAELVVHTHKETTFLPVYFDFDLWKQTEATLETFFTSNILPYLKKSNCSPKICDHIAGE